MLSQDFPTFRLKIGEPGYPSQLAKIPDAPKVLYAKGDMDSKIFKKCLGIVGNEKVSSYGVTVLNHFYAGLAPSGLTVVSGFLKGANKTAHELAILRGMPTVAILPFGIERLKSSPQQALCDAILKRRGLILSEYGGYEEARPWMYAKRDRIIAGLSHALLVIEAGFDKGPLIAYRFARQYKRKTMAVPADIFRANSKGTCQILVEGARPVFSGREVNEILNIRQR